MTTRYFDELTGIRAVAAYLVFFHHFNFFKEKYFGKIIHNIVDEFHIGVTIFFVLSGFLIAYKYLDNVSLQDKNWIKHYFIKRIARVYPLYFILTTITFAFLIITTGNVKENIGLYFANISFLKGFFDELKFSGIAQSWSLTVEECFYFSAPFILILSKRIYLIVIFIIIFLLGLTSVFIFENMDFYGFMGNVRFIILYTFWGRCFEFYVGIKLAMFYNKHYRTLTEVKPIKTVIGALWVICCVVALSLLKKEELGLFTPIGMIINNIVLPVGIAMLFLGLITEKSILQKILSSKLFILLGKSSYAFYLIHIGLISANIFAFFHNQILVFVILNILSILLFRFLEEPLNKIIRKKGHEIILNLRIAKINTVSRKF
jgi:peptidoglycan/LPS O-acetylase OafA/YrhL